MYVCLRVCMYVCVCVCVSVCVCVLCACTLCVVQAGSSVGPSVLPRCPNCGCGPDVTAMNGSGQSEGACVMDESVCGVAEESDAGDTNVFQGDQGSAHIMFWHLQMFGSAAIASGTPAHA